MTIPNLLNRGIQTFNQGDIALAIKSFEKVLSIDRNNADACRMIGIIALKQGKPRRAVEYFLRAIKALPDNDQLYASLGDAYLSLGDECKAVESFEQSVTLNPDVPQVLNNLANTLKNQSKFDQAIKHLQHAINLQPDLALLYFNLGNVYRLTEQNNKAVQCYLQAISINPQFSESYNNLGNALRDLGDAASIEHYQKALALNPGYIDASFNLASTFELQGDRAQALRYYQMAYKLDPDNLEISTARCHLEQYSCNWKAVAVLLGKIVSQISSKNFPPEALLGAPFKLISMTNDMAVNLIVAQQKANQIQAKAKSLHPGFCPQKKKQDNRKFKIGYISGDFFNFATLHLSIGIFRNHDKNDFEVYGYAYGPSDGSSYRKDFVRYCDHFTEVNHLNDAEVALQVHKDDLDILIDLKGHSVEHRLGICALRPAPVQISYLAYPATTGAEFFDYVIADETVLPPEHARFYREKPLYVQGSYLATDDEQVISNKIYTREMFQLPQDAFVFSSFNQPYKIDQKRFYLWMSILKKVPDSILWLMVYLPDARKNILDAASESGIDPARICFTEYLSKPDHLKRLKLADLVLDTDLYNGHTSTVDALYVGVPVVTKIGQHFASRVSASLLKAIELPELIVENEEEYEKLSVRLATDSAFYQLIAEKLNKNKSSTRLFNSKQHTRQLESLYRQVAFD